MSTPLRTTVALVVIALIGVLAAGGAASRPDGVLVGLPDLPGVLAVTGLLLLIAWCGPAGAGPWAGLALVPALWLFGGLALSGPPLWALCLAATASVMTTAPRRPPERLLFPVALVLSLAAAYNVQSRVGPEGDEPHYLMVADSLLQDHDVDVTRDYAEGRYRAFHPKPLEPHFRIRGREGQIYSVHALGLSLLVLPAYAAGGYPAVSLFMALLAALLVLEIRRTLIAFDVSRALATATAWLVALSPPLLHYAGLVFTELPAALLVAFGMRRARESRDLTLTDAALWGGALALLPWLNVRYALFPVVLLLYALARGIPRRSLLVTLAPLAASAIALALYHFMVYGFFDPRRVYGRDREFSLSTMVEGIPGLFLDQEFGLLVYAPVFALVLPGLVRLWRASRRDAALVAVLIGLVVLTAGSWDMWRGGWNPPARFLVPLLPALALGVAYALRSGLTVPGALLIGWGLWTGLAGAAHPELIHRDRDGTAPFFRASSGAEEWTRLLPGFVLAEPDRFRLALPWLALLGLAAMARRPPRLRGVVLSTGMLAAACAWASRTSDARTEGRDAVRVLGRRAVLLPAGRGSASLARWTPAVLSWGPLFEPHRHPEGATIADRLRLPVGTYRLQVEGTGDPPLDRAPELVIRAEDGAEARRVAMEREPSGRGCFARFRVEESDARGLRLALASGSPFVLREIELALQPEAASAVQ